MPLATWLSACSHREKKPGPMRKEDPENTACFLVQPGHHLCHKDILKLEKD